MDVVNTVILLLTVLISVLLVVAPAVAVWRACARHTAGRAAWIHPALARRPHRVCLRRPDVAPGLFRSVRRMARRDLPMSFRPVCVRNHVLGHHEHGHARPPRHAARCRGPHRRCGPARHIPPRCRLLAGESVRLNFLSRAQHPIQAALAPARPQDRQRPQTHAKRRIVRGRLIPLRRSCEARAKPVRRHAWCSESPAVSLACSTTDGRCSGITTVFPVDPSRPGVRRRNHVA